MKKVYTSADIQQKPGEELNKKLYRAISDQAKRLDDARSCVRTISDLFGPGVQAQRRKFCEYCERLIFSDPVLFGRKGEELLWRKAFYDVISTAKKFKKKTYTEDDIANIQAHINSGIGFYHHMLSKLQCHFNINLKNVIDFEIINEERIDLSIEYDKNILDWAQQSVHQCLIYLGDLSRYQLEIYPNWEQTLAMRYYLQAISYRPDYGMPHNQMGTLAMGQNNFLDAVYHYMRCLACQFPFEGTVNNLISLFEKNSKFIEQLPPENNDDNADCIVEVGQSENIKRLLARFLLLIDIWYFNKKVTKLYSLCHQIYKNLEECITYTKPIISSESGETPSDVGSLETESAGYLDSQMLFKIVVICFLTISKLKSTNSPQLSTLIAFTLSVYSQIVQNITNQIQVAVLNLPLPEDSKPSKNHGILKDLISSGRAKTKNKLRRKKVLKNDSDEESDLSDNDNNDTGDTSDSSDDDSFISDTEDVLAESSDDDVDIIKVSNESISEKCKLENGHNSKYSIPSPMESQTTDFLFKKVRKMNVNDMLEIISEEGSLQSVKVLNDWLQQDPEVIKSCGDNTKSLIRQMVFLVNLLNINLSSHKMVGVNLKITEIMKKQTKIPLSEDLVLKNLEFFKNTQKDFDWSYLTKKNITSKEECVIRIVKLLSFAKVLTNIEETGVSFDEDKNILVCKHEEKVEENGVSATAIMEELERQEEQESKSPILNGESKTPNGQISKMKHMGQLWLAAEVRALETRIGGKTALSPYLVVDADSLIKYTYMIKQLVYSRKFIVLVPTAVVQALDDLKKDKLEARDAIRWLETQFHRGNRFFRAQRPQERSPIPFIKYPKKRDKEMHIYIQIVECCHFFAEQQNGAANVVTLLIGKDSLLLTNGENKEFSYVGLAQSVGIAIESVTSFYGKWKKNKGNR